MRRGLACFALLAGCRFDPQLAGSDGSHPPDTMPGPATACDPLPMTGTNVAIADALALEGAIASALPGQTLMLEDGTYVITKTLVVTTPNITIRGEHGDASKVILDGATTQTIMRIQASNVAVTDLTFTHGGPVDLVVEPASSAAGIANVRVHKVTFVDQEGPAVILRPFQGNAPMGPYADDGAITCSHFVQTPASPDVCPARILSIDAGGVRNWTLSDSTFENVACPTAPHRTVAFDDGSRDTKVVNNVFINSSQNIRFGNDPPSSRTYTDPPPTACGMPMKADHWGGVICNNRIIGLGVPPIGGNTDFEEGITLWHACDTYVIHNTIVSPAGSETFHDIEYRYGDQHVVHLINNLLEQLPAARDGAVADYVNSNHTYLDTTGFVDAMKGDVHIHSASAQQGISIAEFAICQQDADGKPRDLANPVVGAYVASP